jgi:citronellol/citronellal dehydrogenase
MATLKEKTIIITGASRGIGRAIALKCAADGAHIVIASKTAEPHPKLEGTIHTVAQEVEEAGGKALPIQLDVRDDANIAQVVEQTIQEFGGIDVLVNNAGAISLTNTETTPMKRYDLMQGINARAVFACSQACLPYLKKAENPHILNLSPPISLNPKWLQNNVAYTISKYGMTLCTIGMSAEFENYGISVNSLWPRTLISTAAVHNLMGDTGMNQGRKPEIMADATYAILTTTDRKITGQVLIDEVILREHGVSDFEQYAYKPGEELLPDYYIDG